MENHLSINPFMFGMRPSSADFGLYGQLTQLIGFDPTPRNIAYKQSPRCVSWVNIMSDLSGLHDKGGVGEFFGVESKSDNNNEIIELIEDTSRDLMNYDLEYRIQELESKFSKDLSETTFNELKELKKKQNIN